VEKRINSPEMIPIGKDKSDEFTLKYSRIIKRITSRIPKNLVLLIPNCCGNVCND
jgi:hypothetical protein